MIIDLSTFADASLAWLEDRRTCLLGRGTPDTRDRLELFAIEQELRCRANGRRVELPPIWDQVLTRATLAIYLDRDLGGMATMLDEGDHIIAYELHTSGLPYDAVLTWARNRAHSVALVRITPYAD